MLRVLLSGFILSLLMIRIVDAGESPTDAVKIAEAHGAQAFADIERIRFTFNVQAGERNAQRQWEWSPKTGEVSFTGLDAGLSLSHTYQQAKIKEGDAALNEKVDRWFINDQYWLLFPLHLVWDTGCAITANGRQTLPLGSGEARSLTVAYGDSVGYTPGDAYDLFYDDDFRLAQWVFRKGGAMQPTRAVTWEGYAQVGPLLLSLEHRDGEGKFRLWFSEVAVKLVGQADWQTAVIAH